MTDNLDKLSDAELSEVFAVEVAGWIRINTSRFKGVFAAVDWPVFEKDGKRASNKSGTLPSFASSADVVLPWLEARLRNATPDWSRGTMIWELSFDGVHASSHSLARTICIALIRSGRSKRVEKGQP